jgi:hypothetical protein
MVTDPRQDDFEISICVTIYVGLYSGVPPALEPSDTVGGDI